MTNKIYSFLFFQFVISFFFLTSIFSQSQLIGNWEGELTVENEGNVLSSFKMLLQINSDSAAIEGQSWVWYNDKKAVFSFKGQLQREILRIKDVALVEYDKLGAGEWCYKEMELVLSHTRKLDKLVGTWTGHTTFSKCQPGKISLKKVTKRA